MSCISNIDQKYISKGDQKNYFGQQPENLLPFYGDK